MTQSNHRAMVVEDDRSWQQILTEILMDCGLEVDSAGTLEDAVSKLKTQPHRLTVIDLSLSPDDHNNIDGLRVLDAVRKLDPNCRSILLTGFATVELAVSALNDYGAFTFLRKENFNRGQFRDLIFRVLASPPQKSTTTPVSTGEIKNNLQVAQLVTKKFQKKDLEKALVVEDDAGWRSILEELLKDAGYHVLVCSSFGEGLGYLRREKISLAVVDLLLNGSITNLWDQKIPSEDLEGFQLLASTRAASIPTIVVSGIASADEIKKAYSEEAIFAYLEKQSFDRVSFLKIVEEAGKIQKSNDELSLLTDREREVFELLAQGMTNKEIAESLVITTNTVKRHLKSIFEKLDIHTRSAAAAKAVGNK